MKKLFGTILALIMLLLLPVTAHAMEFTPEEGANTLYELGLFQGTGTTANGKPVYSLQTAPTRAQAVTMLVRLLGKEDEAKSGTWELPFTDVEAWAQPYVGYAYANGLTNGLSATAFGSGAAVTYDQYATFLLRALGYSSETDFEWSRAGAYAASLGLSTGQDNAKRGSFTRGDTAALSAAALAQPVKGGARTLAAVLAENGAIDATLAAEYGYLTGADSRGMLRLSNSSYTFRNSAGQYLAASGRKLTLSSTPYVWSAARVSGDMYQLRCDADRTLMLDVENADFSVGTTVSLCEDTGYDAQYWQLQMTGDGRCHIVSAPHPELALSTSGGFRLSGQSSGEQWTVQCVRTDRAKYFETTSRGGEVTLQTEYRMLDLISRQRLQKWADDLETAYGDYAELTGWQPYTHVYYNMYEDLEYWGYATSTDTLHIDRDCIYEDVRDHLSKRKNDWNFGLLHEMSHLFDMDKPWNFHAEVVCDYKLAYVLVKNNATAIPSELPASVENAGWGILDVYQRMDFPLSQSLSIFNLAGKLAEITKQTGWDAAKRMFRNYPAEIPATAAAQLELFVEQLGKAGGVDARAMFTDAEWRSAMQIGEL